MQAGNQPEEAIAVMTAENIAEYICYEEKRGTSENALRRYRHYTDSLYDWLPEDKVITKDRLLSWREHLKLRGYSSDTELKYVKGINRYLDYLGCTALRFNRGRPKDLAGMQFGYLTAIEPVGTSRRNILWRCWCRCGKEGEYPATRLVTGKTMSCGCLRQEWLRESNKYIDGTSLRWAMEDRVFSDRTASGYTGVIQKRGKWQARIKYKGKIVSLGTYTKLEDAVKARARGKELVRLDAMGLLDFYESLHENDPAKPDREQVRRQRTEPAEPVIPKTKTVVLRSDNSSGYPGVSRKREKWQARITYQKKTYLLGTFDTIERAIAERREAEERLHRDPEEFKKWITERTRSVQIKVS